MLPMRPWHSGYDMNSRRGRDNPTPLPHSAPLPRSNSQIGEIVVAEQPALFAYFHEYVWQGVFLVLVIVYAMSWVDRIR